MLPFSKKFLITILPFSTSLAMAQPKHEGKSQVTNEPEAILRTEGPMVNMKLNSDRSLMAFVDERGQSLRILDLATSEVIELTPHRVGDAFFWSPDKTRLFFRELVLDGKKVTSTVKAYDFLVHKTLTLDTFDGSSGYLTLDPRDYSFYMMHEKGIASRRMEFPGERFARWQLRAKKSLDLGRFVATQKSVLWLTDLGLTLNTLPDDGSGVESFDISPDGSTIAWSTHNAQVFVSHLGEKPKLIGPGRDPRWHESRSLLLYSAGRVVGSKVYDYDIRVTDMNGNGRFITNTQGVAERWPQWWRDGGIIYTRDKTTDLWKIQYRENQEVTAKSESQQAVAQ